MLFHYLLLTFIANPFVSAKRWHGIFDEILHKLKHPFSLDTVTLITTAWETAVITIPPSSFTLTVTTTSTVTPIPSIPTTNAIVNGGFEDAVPSPWSIGKQYEVNYTVKMDPANAHSGSKYWELFIGPGGGYLNPYQKSIPVAKLREYEFSTWVRIDHPTEEICIFQMFVGNEAPNPVEAEIYAFTSRQQLDQSYASYRLVTTGPFTPKVLAFKIEMLLYCNVGNRTVYLDDVALTQSGH